MQNYDIQIGKGTSLNLSLTLTGTSGVPIDLSNCIVSGFIKSKYSNNGLLINLNPNISSPSSAGIITLSIPATGTFLLPTDIFPYDILAYNTGNNNVIQILQGYAYIYPLVTY